MFLSYLLDFHLWRCVTVAVAVSVPVCTCDEAKTLSPRKIDWISKKQEKKQKLIKIKNRNYQISHKSRFKGAKPVHFMQIKKIYIDGQYYIQWRGKPIETDGKPMECSGNDCQQCYACRPFIKPFSVKLSLGDSPQLALLSIWKTIDFELQQKE